MQEGSQLTVVFAVSSLIIALILILVILFVLAYHKRVATQQIKLQKIESQHQLHLLQATIETQERERKRIASDLHDDVGSLLSALKLNVSFLELNEEDEVQRKFLVKTREKLENGIDQVRRISHDMFPPTLNKYGLWKALDELLFDLNESGAIQAKLTQTIENVVLEPLTELATYRVIQELVSNTLRHAEASTIEIKVERNQKALMIYYMDNGMGLEVKAKPNGLGLMNMQSRMQTIAGSIDFGESNNPGFFAKLTIPLS